MLKTGIIGWRGMVGSVLMKRLQEEGDLDEIDAYLFSTSLNGQRNKTFPSCHDVILNSNAVDELREMDVLISCQGSAYSKKIQPALRESDWKGYWIDSASAFRMHTSSTIVLDPINNDQILKAIDDGKKDFIGGNCTVSVLLMALGGLFEEGLIEWVSADTYQAASGAGAMEMIELLNQSHFLTSKYIDERNPGTSALEYERILARNMGAEDFPEAHIGQSLAFSLLPWIDRKMATGQSREEWKAQAEANKILDTDQLIPIDGNCVRIASMRCHAEAFTIKLNREMEINRLEQIISEHNEWVDVVPNEREATLARLTPQQVSGSLNIPVGRLRKMTLGSRFLNAFTIGDQLLWGAAEPLRRVLHLIKA